MTSPAQPELSTSEVVAALKATRLFSVLEPPELLALSPLFVPVRLEPGDVVCSQGQVDRCLWVVVDGAVGLSAEGGTEAPAAYRAFGDTLGLCGVFLGEARGSTAVVVQPAVLLRAERLPFLAALARHRDLYDRLVLDESIRSRLTPGELPKAAGGEYRVGLYRRHWVVLARRLVLPAAMLVGLLLAAAVVSGLTALGPGSSPALALLLVAVALGVPGALAVWVFYDYYHDVLIVTNRRIVHIERTPFVDAARTEALLTRVQDVTSVVPGPTARAVGYGTVIVQTASTRGAIAFDRVPRPDAVRDTIVRQLDQSKEEVRRERDDWLRDKVLRAIGGHEAVPPPVEPQEAPRPGASEPVAFHRLVLGSLGSMAGHFWPQMRSQEGDVITWRKHWVVLLRAALLPCAVLGCLALVGGSRTGGTTSTR
jgi:membrane protein YdbS with pleckstrin-like domain